MASVLLCRWICVALVLRSTAETSDETQASCSRAVPGGVLIQHSRQVQELHGDHPARLHESPTEASESLDAATHSRAQPLRNVVLMEKLSKVSASDGYGLFGVSAARTLTAWPSKIVLTGAVCGCLAGAAGGLAAVFAGMVTDKGGLTSIAGVLAGGLIGGTFGYLGHIGFFPLVMNIGTPQAVTDSIFDEPLMDKLEHLAMVIASVAGYEEQLYAGANEEFKDYSKDKKAALKILEHLYEIEQDPDRNGGEVEHDFSELEEIMSHGHTSEFESAETALSNQALLTEHDIAAIEHGERGEDEGPANATTKGRTLTNSREWHGEADMLFAPRDSNSTRNATKLIQHTGETDRIAAGTPWRNAQVSYCIAPDVSEHMKHLISAALMTFSKAIPCLKFEDVGVKRGDSRSPMEAQECNKSPAVFLMSNPGEGCYAYVGMVEQLRSQRVQLQDPACASLGIIKHEMGHALGMAHEQSRVDRGKHVRVFWSNIQNGKEANFKVERAGYVQSDYDILSIMHYDSYAFATDRSQVTIEQIGAITHDEMGQRNSLSANDVEQLAHMYEYEDASCVATNLNGQGCVDKPDPSGGDVCSSLTKCTSEGVDKCCACGGGTKVACYKGSPCPKVERLPPPEGADCIEDITFHFPGRGYPCIYRNRCEFDVKFKCPSHPCTHVARRHKATMTYCGSLVQREICQANACTVWKA